MAEKFTRWDVTEHLRTREDVRLYLEACADEDPGDGSLIRAALNDKPQEKPKKTGRRMGIQPLHQVETDS